MIVILGLIILVAALVVGVAGVLSNAARRPSTSGCFLAMARSTVTCSTMVLSTRTRPRRSRIRPLGAAS